MTHALHDRHRGSCLKNPGGPGGYAAVIFRDDDLIEELRGGEAVTTNNRMELMAAVVGLRAVREPSVITLYSDCQYLIKTLTLGWKRMKNVDLWTWLDAAARPHRITWQCVRGHHGNAGNVRADALANRAARLHGTRVCDGPFSFRHHPWQAPPLS